MGRAQALSTTTSPVLASTSATPNVGNTEDVPLNGVILQGGSQTCKRIPDEDESAYFDQYAQAFGDMPGRATQPTIDQLSCFKAIVMLLTSIFVDFAVFVPYGNRLLHKINSLGHTIGSGGALRPFEIFGPPSI